MSKPAAGPWREGRPTSPGRYLIEYEQFDQRKVFIADLGLVPVGEDIKLEWMNITEDMEVLRYAKINSEYINYR